MTSYWRALVDVHGPAIRTARFAFLGDVEEHPGVARPEGRAGQRAVQRQLLLRDLDLPRLLELHRRPRSPTGVSQCLRFSSLPVTTSKNAFCIALVTGPARPSPMLRPSSSRIGVTSAAVPVKKHSSAM